MNASANGAWCFRRDGFLNLLVFWELNVFLWSLCISAMPHEVFYGNREGASLIGVRARTTGCQPGYRSGGSNVFGRFSPFFGEEGEDNGAQHSGKDNEVPTL